MCRILRHASRGAFLQRGFATTAAPSTAKLPTPLPPTRSAPKEHAAPAQVPLSFFAPQPTLSPAVGTDRTTDAAAVRRKAHEDIGAELRDMKRRTEAVLPRITARQRYLASLNHGRLAFSLRKRFLRAPEDLYGLDKTEKMGYSEIRTVLNKIARNLHNGDRTLRHRRRTYTLRRTVAEGLGPGSVPDTLQKLSHGWDIRRPPLRYGLDVPAILLNGLDELILESDPEFKAKLILVHRFLMACVPGAVTEEHREEFERAVAEFEAEVATVPPRAPLRHWSVHNLLPLSNVPNQSHTNLLLM